MTPLPGATREAHSAARRDAHRRKQSIVGTFVIAGLSVGLVVAASFPLLTTAAALGAATALLARRAHRAIDELSLSVVPGRDSRHRTGERRTARLRG